MELWGKGLGLGHGLAGFPAKKRGWKLHRDAGQPALWPKTQSGMVALCGGLASAAERLVVLKK